jgi:hypothetical protein
MYRLFCSKVTNRRLHTWPQCIGYTLFLITLLLIFANSAVATESNTSSDVFIQDIGKLSELRTQAESRVRLLRGLYQDGEIDAKAMRRGELLYEDARAAFNAWLDAMIAGFSEKAGGIPEATVSDLLQRGAKRNDAFITFADEKILGQTRGGGAEAAALIVAKVIDTGMNLWRELRASNDKRRHELISHLDDLHWKAFGDID